MHVDWIQCLPGWLGMWSSMVLAAWEGCWPSLIRALIFRKRSILTSSLFPMLNKPAKKKKKKNHVLIHRRPCHKHLIHCEHCCYHEYRSKILSTWSSALKQNSMKSCSWNPFTVYYTKQQEASVKTQEINYDKYFISISKCTTMLCLKKYLFTTFSSIH